MMTMWAGVVAVSPSPKRQRKSTIGTVTPRRLSTPRTYSGWFGSGVTFDHSLISRTAMMSTPY